MNTGLRESVLITFKKTEGNIIHHLLDILSYKLHHKIESTLFNKEHFSIELTKDYENTGSYIVVGGKPFPNTTFAFKVSTLKQISEGIDYLLEEILTNLGLGDQVLFRQRLHIEEQEVSARTYVYLISIRLAIITADVLL